MQILRGLTYFIANTPNRTHPFAWWQHFPCRAHSIDAGKDVSKEKEAFSKQRLWWGLVLLAALNIQAGSLLGSKHPEPGKGAQSKGLGVLLAASATASCLCSTGLLLLALQHHGVCELLHRGIFLVFAVPCKSKKSHELHGQTQRPTLPKLWPLRVPIYKSI